MKDDVGIGIIGKGFVGNAVYNGFSAQTGFNSNIYIYDKDPLKSLNTLEEVVSNSDFIFISVPTPSNPDGSVNTDNIHNVISDINKTKDKENSIILVRSTVVPGTTGRIAEEFPELNIVFNPEFLTERSANLDFISQTRIVLGGPSEIVAKVGKLYKSRFGQSMPIITTDYKTAELIKYMNNTFFAAKVSFMNDMYKLSESIGASWEDAVEGFIRDGRIGHSHTQVPGPDNKFGFGGSCFPKDTRALLHFAQSIDVDLNVLEGAWKTNLEVRPEKDWENLKGRSVL
tara:strand:- start:51 stop:908 length:858 start_codon:yes stop_codon:yes gene_type:complete